MKSEFFKESVKPILVLCAICVAVSALLAYTNSITAPIIEQTKAAEAEAARAELLPEAKSFTELSVEPDGVVTSAYEGSDGTGYVITSAAKGYGGPVECTVAVSIDGVIRGLKIDATTETTGVGTKVARDDFIGKFVGLDAGVENVDVISGASYSSRAVKTSVAAALEYVNELRGA